MAYDNILAAVSNRPDGGLTLQQQAENYSAFSDLMSKGVYIPDLIKRMDSLESKIKTLEDRPTAAIDPELLAVMEAAVKSNPEVKEARQRMADAKSAVISDLCMADQRYRKASEDYRNAVNRAYVELKEDGTERASEVQTGP